MEGFSYESEGSRESLLIKQIRGELRGCKSKSKKDNQRGCKDATALLKDQMLDDWQPPKGLIFKRPLNDSNFPTMALNVKGKV
jgi:hypothetical protein